MLEGKGVEEVELILLVLFESTYRAVFEYSLQADSIGLKATDHPHHPVQGLRRHQGVAGLVQTSALKKGTDQTGHCLSFFIL